MMTCVSLRSGMASSGTFFIDHQPATAAKPISRNTAALLRPENSMMRSIMRRRLQLAFGVDEKVAGGHDPLAGAQTLQDLDAAAGALAGRDLPRLDVSVAAVHENHFFEPGVEHRFGGNGEPVRLRRG